MKPILFLTLLIVGSCGNPKEENWKQLTSEEFQFDETTSSLNKVGMDTLGKDEYYKETILVSKRFIIGEDTVEISREVTPCYQDYEGFLGLKKVDFTLHKKADSIRISSNGLYSIQHCGFDEFGDMISGITMVSLVEVQSIKH